MVLSAIGGAYVEQFKSKKKYNKADGRNNGMSNALKFLLLAAGCGLVILLITVAVMTAKKGEDDTNANLDQYSRMAGEYEDIDLKVYDSSVILGSEVKDLIKGNSGDSYLSIKVLNGKGNTTDYIHVSTIASNIVTIGAVSAAAVSASPADLNYINDSGTFLCETLYDQNGVVACLRLKQQ
jgi:hypothetical protein